MCMELQCKPIWDTLFEWARWITPEQERYRYDTYFYMIPIKKSRQLDASHDGLDYLSKKIKQVEIFILFYFREGSYKS